VARIHKHRKLDKKILERLRKKGGVASRVAGSIRGVGVYEELGMGQNDQRGTRRRRIQEGGVRSGGFRRSRQEGQLVRKVITIRRSEFAREKDGSGVS